MIYNNPKRKKSTPYKWGAVVKPSDTICIGGGSAWQSDDSVISDLHLHDIKAIGCSVIYPLNFEKSPLWNLEIIDTIISMGIPLAGIRYDNEAGNNISLSDDVGDVFLYGKDKAKEYLDSCETLAHYISHIKCRRILSGIYPSNQQGSRYTQFRKGWNTYLNENLNELHAIDLHVYDRCGELEIDFNYFNEIKDWKRSVLIIESGAVNFSSMSQYIERTKRVWTELAKVIRPIDELGAHPLDQPNGGIGLVNNVQLNDCFMSIEDNHKRIVHEFIRWGFQLGPFKMRPIVMLTDGREAIRNGFIEPKAGDVWD